jgi:hypothetical protein
MADEVSYILEVARKMSRPTYANFKNAASGEAAYKNAIRLDDIERVRLIMVDQGRQKTILEHSTVVAPTMKSANGARGRNRKLVAKSTRMKPSPGMGSISLGITFSLILLVIFFTLKFGFDH